MGSGRVALGTGVVCGGVGYGFLAGGGGVQLAEDGLVLEPWKYHWKSEQGLEVIGMELWVYHCKVELRLELELDKWLDEVLLELEHWKVSVGLMVGLMEGWKVLGVGDVQLAEDGLVLEYWKWHWKAEQGLEVIGIDPMKYYWKVEEE